MDALNSFSLNDIGSAIQFAIAPIFLLVAAGAILNVVTARLGRIVDRARTLEKFIEDGEAETLEHRHLGELRTLDDRMKYGNRAVFFCTLSAVLICFLVAVLFLLAFFSQPAGLVIATLFIFVVTALSIGLIFFLMEVTLATRVLRVRTEILARKGAPAKART